MRQSARSLKEAAGAAGTLALVVLLYGAPVILSVMIGAFRSPFGVSSGVDVAGEREVVYWNPPPVETPEGDAASDAEEAGDEGDAEPEGDAPDPASPDSSAADAASDVLAVPSETLSRPEVIVQAKRVRRAAARGPKRELTKKQKRLRAKYKRRRERIAQRKQCAELQDQILQIDEDEYWFGREIANCYRTHLQQFDLLGGAWFANDDDGDPLGVGVSVSRGKRGEPARLAGWKTGDVILSVNGIRVRKWGGISLAATQLMRGRVRVKRLRGGEKESVLMRVVSKDALEEKRRALEAVASEE